MNRIRVPPHPVPLPQGEKGRLRNGRDLLPSSLAGEGWVRGYWLYCYLGPGIGTGQGTAPMDAPDWTDRVFEALKEAGVRQAAYVPDAGHSKLIELFRADPRM